MRVLMVTLLLLGVVAVDAAGQWCSPQSPGQGTYHWVEGKDFPQYVYLHWNNTVVGAWGYIHKRFWYWDSNSRKWSQAYDKIPAGVPEPPKVELVPVDNTCPCKCNPECKCNPCQCAHGGQRCSPGCKCGESRVAYNGGIDLDKLKPIGERYSLSGVAVTKAEALAALEGDTRLPNDAGKGHLTIIGTLEHRQQVLRDFDSHPSLLPWKDKLVFHSYSPVDWEVLKAGFVVTGNPTIYVQREDGYVLWRQDSYLGPEHLAEVIRKASPNYDPSKDPTPNSIPGVGPLWAKVKDYLPQCCIVGALVLVWYRKEVLSRLVGQEPVKTPPKRRRKSKDGGNEGTKTKAA